MANANVAGEMLERIESLARELLNNYEWEETPEGDDFWNFIHDELCELSDVIRRDVISRRDSHLEEL